MDLDRLHRRARLRRANLFVYGFVRVTFQAFFLTYLRMQRIGREHLPRTGPVIVAANHRSFLDPFVIACMARRPMYYVAKKEIFQYHPVVAWLLAALGAFPIDRGAGDAESVATAKAILARGDIVLIFPEGTRTRPGGLGRPKRGVGRLALETGAPVVPVAVIGTGAVRRGWRIRPRQVRIRAGRPLRFPQVDAPSVELAGAVTDRIWPCVMLQWEWLGGLPPVRRATIIGSGAGACSLAACLARAGVQLDLFCPTAEEARTVRAARESGAPGLAAGLPDQVRILPLSDIDLTAAETVCLVVPAGELPAILAAPGGPIPRGSRVLVACEGMVPPGVLPSAFATERCRPHSVAVLAGPGCAERLAGGASVVLASLDRGFARQISEPLQSAGLEVSCTTDVTGVELASCATRAAALAAAVAVTRAGAATAGAAAGKVFAEIEALARARGARPGTFTGLAGVGALIDAVMSPDRASPSSPHVGRSAALGGDDLLAAPARESIPLLLSAARRAQVPAPVLDGLGAVLEGRIAADWWAETLTQPSVGGEPPRASRPAAVDALRP